MASASCRLTHRHQLRVLLTPGHRTLCAHLIRSARRTRAAARRPNAHFTSAGSGDGGGRGAALRRRRGRANLDGRTIARSFSAKAAALETTERSTHPWRISAGALGRVGRPGGVPQRRLLARGCQHQVTSVDRHRPDNGQPFLEPEAAPSAAAARRLRAELSGASRPMIFRLAGLPSLRSLHPLFPS